MARCPGRAERSTRQAAESREVSTPRPLSLVRFVFEGIPDEFVDKYPFDENRTYVFLGEIPNMPGHCVVADHRSGKVFSGYHTEGFSELPEDEV